MLPFNIALDHDTIFKVLGLIIVLTPFLLVLALGGSTLVGRPLSETAIGRLVQWTTVLGLVASIAILALMLIWNVQEVPIEFTHWASLPNYHFAFKFVFDRLSVPMVILTYVLCGTISAFANSYMHREPGFNRFFVLYSFFVLGMVMAITAGTIETLFSGWELVGLSSALLVAFYQMRKGPVSNGLHVWTVYRISDAAFLVAAVVMHHMVGHGDLKILLGSDHPWPFGHADKVTADQALILGGLLLVTAAGKSGLVPFSGWLPRAMEGPTPSSAVFYGALSIHLGAYLLLRTSPILDRSPTLSILVCVVGLVTALYGTFVGRVQTDIKSALTFASLTQVGLIVAEIGLGLRYLPLIHILGHACFRTLQFVRAPSLLYDYHVLENAVGKHLRSRPNIWQRLLPASMQIWLFRFGLERGFLDGGLKTFFVVPFLKIFSICDGLEDRWIQLIGGRKAPAKAPALTELLDDLA